MSVSDPKFDHADDAQRELGVFKAAIAELVDLSPDEYLFKYKEIARKYNISADKLDKLIRDRKKADEERAERARADAAFAAAALARAKAEAEPKPAAADDSGLIEKLRESAKPLIEAENVLALVREHLTEHEGYAGATLPAERTFVALCSRFTNRPLNIRRLAPSGTGKSYTVDVVLPLFDEKSTYFKFSASSEKALIYEEQSFEHKYLIVGEQDSIPTDGPAAAAIRSIIQDGEMRYPTVDRAEDNKLKTRHIVKKGPTGVITTGIVAPEDDQLDTRVLTDLVSDDVAQTRAILTMQARIASGAYTRSTGERQKFVDFQKLLELTGERRVSIPYAEALARLLPTANVRIRRDHLQILTVIETLAFIAQFHSRSERDSDGRIIASWVDYEGARGLFMDVLDVSIPDGVSATVRETVMMVMISLDTYSGPADEDAPIVRGHTIPDLSYKLGLSKNGTWARVNNGIKGGYLANVEQRRGWPAFITVTQQPLPPVGSVLPSSEALQAEFKNPTAQAPRTQPAAASLSDAEVIPV